MPWRRSGPIGVLWRLSKLIADKIADVVPPARWKVPAAILRVVAFVFLATGSLVQAIVRRILPTSPGVKLRNEVAELWNSGQSYDALILLQSVYDQLRVEEAAGRLGLVVATVDIPPFGRFSERDLVPLMALLTKRHLDLGHHEEAISILSSFPEDWMIVGMKVDVLVCCDRNAEAIALLERSLHLDNWRGSLRQRLTDLGGSVSRGTN